jgi:flagellar secretion chaperone FliS
LADKENNYPPIPPIHFKIENMNAFARFVANTYATVDVTTGVASATPHALTLMLYDAALKHMGKAQMHMAAGRIAEKGAAITRAIRIVEEGLTGPLDLSQGEIAHNLKSLYDYINNCLLNANMRNDSALLEEARSLLAGMRETWAAIGPGASENSVQARVPATISSFGSAAA